MDLCKVNHMLPYILVSSQLKHNDKLIPSPQGDFLVVIWRTLVGILTGPLTLNFLSLAPRTKSAHTGKYEQNKLLDKLNKQVYNNQMQRT